MIVMSRSTLNPGLTLLASMDSWPSLERQAVMVFISKSLGRAKWRLKECEWLRLPSFVSRLATTEISLLITWQEIKQNI